MGFKVLAQQGCGLSEVMKTMMMSQQLKQLADLQEAQKTGILAHANYENKLDPNLIYEYKNALLPSQIGSNEATAAERYATAAGLDRKLHPGKYIVHDIKDFTSGVTDALGNATGFKLNVPWGNTPINAPLSQDPSAFGQATDSGIPYGKPYKVTP